MKNFIKTLTGGAILLAALIIIPLPAAQAEPSTRGRNNFQPFLTRPRTTLDVSGGLSRSDMNFTIAGDSQGANPNIAEDFKWKGVKTIEAEARLRHYRPASKGPLRGDLQLEANLRGGLGLDGSVDGASYLGDNRTLQIGGITADADSGYTLGAQAALGYRFNIAQRIRPTTRSFLTLAPLIGYGWEKEQFKLEGFQVFPVPVPPAPYYKSEYNAQWHGPFIGLEAQWEHNRHMLTLRGEYHRLNYKGDAEWDLSPGLQQDPSFEHDSSDGSARKIMFEYGYAIDSRYEFVLNLSHIERESGSGSETVFPLNGAPIKRRLNEARHDTQSIRAGLKYHW